MNKSEEDHFESGYHLSIESAKALLKVAELAVNNGEAGIATSLAILAAEEGVKAIILMTKSLHPELSPDSFKEMFGKHDFKHERIISMLLIYEIRNRAMKELEEEIIEKLEIQSKELGVDSENFKRAYWEKFGQSGYKFENIPSVDIEKLKNWWKYANNWKNEGFYVDDRSKSWHNPRATKKRKYISAKEYAVMLIDLAQVFYEMKADKLNPSLGDFGRI